MILGYDPYVGTSKLFSPKEIIEEVARAGYDSINIPFKPDFLNPRDQTNVREILELVRANDLKTPSICVGPHIWTTPGKEGEIRELVELGIAVAGKFEASLLTIWPNQPPDVTRDDAIKTLTANLKEAIPKVDAAGLAIAFEFEKGCPIDNYREAVEYVNEVDARLKIVADTYHLFNDGANFYEAALAMRGMLGEIHLSGSDRGEPGNPNDKCDYEGFMKGVREIGFDGSIMLQYKLTERESVARACNFARKLLSG